MLRHVFTIAVLLITLGFALAFYRDYRQDHRIQKERVAWRVDLNTQIETNCQRRMVGQSPAALARCRQLAEEQGKRIDEVVDLLIRQTKHKERIESALAQARQGKMGELLRLLGTESQRRFQGKASMFL